MEAQQRFKESNSKPNKCKILLLFCSCLSIAIYILVFIVEYHNASIATSDFHHNRLQNNQASLALLQLQEANNQIEPINDKVAEPIINHNFNNLNNTTNTKSKQICNYLAVKGLPYSGTQWLKYILTIIQLSICNKTQTSDEPLCRQTLIGTKLEPKHVGDWMKFSKTAIDDRIDVSMKDKEYIKIQRMFMKDPTIRFCSFIAMRDPRDAMMTQIYWIHYKRYFKSGKHEYDELSKDFNGIGIDPDEDEDHFEINGDTVNANILQHFGVKVQELNEYWDYYKDKEGMMPDWYFTYFYEDLVNEVTKRNVIKNMLVFIGVYPDVLGDEDLDAIVMMIGFEQMLEDDEFSMQREGKVCNYNNEMNQLEGSTVEFMRDIMIKFLRSELLYKFNSACPVN